MEENDPSANTTLPVPAAQEGQTEEAQQAAQDEQQQEEEQQPSVEEQSNGNVGDDDGIAFAAHAAAQAMSESDAAAQAAEGDEEEEEEEEEEAQEDTPVVCRICGRSDEDGRPLLRFLPVEHDMAAAAASPTVTSFSQDIALHIFCGKTASILPSVNQPELEILTKAGLKNKHGIGPEVNAALARTRCAILAQEGSKEKHFYLVREFEAHLAAIRHTRITYMPAHMAGNETSLHQTEFPSISEVVNQPVPLYDQTDNQQQPPDNDEQTRFSQEPNNEKTVPVRAAAGHVDKSTNRYNTSQDTATVPVNSELTQDGKIRCGCGGSHLPTGTARGVQSWRSHVMTKRHQKWMEENGLLGAV